MCRVGTLGPWVETIQLLSSCVHRPWWLIICLVDIFTYLNFIGDRGRTWLPTSIGSGALSSRGCVGPQLRVTSLRYHTEELVTWEFVLRPAESWHCNSFLQACGSTMTSKEEQLIPSWDGELHGCPDYSRRVRLCFSQTPASKRYTLGPKLVLRLKGKAWEISASLDHELLGKTNGAQYLLRFLRSKLGRLPIPDIGQHLDEVFVKLRRNYGCDMISWCNQVREPTRSCNGPLPGPWMRRRPKGCRPT